MYRLLPVLLIAAGVAACGDRPAHQAHDAHEATEVHTPPAGEWIALFDGSSLDAFRGFRRDTVPASWTIVDSTLQFMRSGDGGDLITRDQFGDFELEFEWKISEAGNSGVIYRATEEFDAPWKTGPEYQVLDNLRHPDARFGPDRMAGAAYDIYPTDSLAVRPVGEWNASRILVHGDYAEHWLNGKMVLSYRRGSDDWNARLAESKWVSHSEFARRDRGHIAFQDHGDPVWYRNIRVMPH